MSVVNFLWPDVDHYCFIIPALIISVNFVSCLSCCSGSAKSQSQIDDWESENSRKQQHCVIVSFFWFDH